MATQTVTFAYQTGKTLTLKLCSLDSDAIVDSVSATERATDLGTYEAEFTDVAAGTYRAKVYIGAVPYASGFVKLTASTDTFEVTNDPIVQTGGEIGGQTTTISLGVSGMEWWITTDEAGNSTIASGTTPESGDITVLLTNGNTYYLWARKIGYNDIIAQSFVASAD